MIGPGLGYGGSRGGMGLHRGGMGRKTSDLLAGERSGTVYDHRIMKRLLRYLGPYRWLAFGTILLSLINAGTQLAGPYLIKLGIDRFIATGDVDGLNLLAALFVGNSALTWLSQYLQAYGMAVLGQRVLFNLRMEMFERFQRLSLGFFDNQEVGRLMSRVQNDVGVLQELLSSGIQAVFSDLLILAGIVVIMFSMNASLALLTYTILPLLVITIAVWQRYSREAFRQVRSAISAVNAGLQENISGVRVIQSLSREDVNFQRFGTTNEAHLDANLHAGRLSALLAPIVELLSAMAMALVIVYGGSRVLSGELTAGALVAFTLYIGRFFDPVRDLSLRYNNLQMSMAASERIFEVLDTQPAIVEAGDAVDLPELSGAVSFEGVAFQYGEGAPVLQDLSFRIRPGETVALVGPSGAGKTTTVSLIARFYDVQRGAVKVDGHDVRTVKLASLRRQLGFVPQEPFLFSGSIRENIAYGRPDASDQEVRAAARAVGADEFIQQLDDGYATQVQERGGRLSAGQRQLISFARALLIAPRILILDEATSSVDAHTEAQLQRALSGLLAGRTAIVIAHRLSTVRSMNRLLVVEGGRLVEEGNHDELLARGGVYARLYESGLAYS